MRICISCDSKYYFFFLRCSSFKQTYNETLIVFTQVLSWILKRFSAFTVATYCKNYWTRFGLGEFRFRCFRRIPMKTKRSWKKSVSMLNSYILYICFVYIEGENTAFCCQSKTVYVNHPLCIA